MGDTKGNNVEMGQSQKSEEQNGEIIKDSRRLLGFPCFFEVFERTPHRFR